MFKLDILTAFLSGPYGFMLKIGVVVAVIGAIWFAGVRFEHNRLLPKIEAAKSDAELWKKTADNRLNLIQAQNSAFEGLKAAYELRVSELNKRLATAILEGQNYRKKAEKKAEAIIALPVSKNECTALTELIDEARK